MCSSTRLRARKSNKSHVNGSAQCRSSNATTMAPSSPRSVISSNSGANRSPAALPSTSPPARPSRRAASVGCDVSTAGFDRATSRRSSANGASGITSPAIGRQRPRIRGAPARRTPSATSVDFPMPPSPLTKHHGGRASPGARNRLLEGSQFVSATDELGGGGRSRHEMPSIAAPDPESEGACPMWPRGALGRPWG